MNLFSKRSKTDASKYYYSINDKYLLDIYARTRFQVGGVTLYHEKQYVNWERVPHCRPLDHTMYGALDNYVAQKLPQSCLFQALIEGANIEVHGIYPEHFESLYHNMGFEIQRVDFSTQRQGKQLNYVRPAFFRIKSQQQQKLCVAVTPGREYLLHYAGLIRHYLFHHTSRAQSTMKIIHYPMAEYALAKWSELETGFVQLGDRIVVGYVEDIKYELEKAGVFRSGITHTNDYYTSSRHKLSDGSIVNFIGVKYSFWASIAGRLAAAFCKAGASEIIYCGKLGCLSNPADIYDRIFCPSRFHLMEHYHLMDPIISPPNHILNRFPQLDSKGHVSVPTVMEEDYMQREAAGNVGASTIDNEISHMAAAISQFNHRNKKHVAFSAIHFATDYIRSASERTLEVHFDLSVNREDAAISQKTAIIKKIALTFLGSYFSN